ncbi:MAG: hypothetical protein ACMUIS_12785 [bacterium]
MAERIDSKAGKESRALFSDLVSPARMVFFTQKHPALHAVNSGSS